MTDTLPMTPSGSGTAPGGYILVAAVSENAALVSLSSGLISAGAITFRSTDNGASWQTANLGLISAFSINKFIVDGNRLFGLALFNLHISDDQGAQWQELKPNPPKRGFALYADFASAVKDGLLLVLDISGEMQISTDNGSSWDELSGPREFARSVAIGNSSLFAVNSRGSLFIRPLAGLISNKAKTERVD